MITSFLYNFFQIKEHNSTIKRELYAGLVTFLTMAYIAFVNPNILSATGMDKNAIFVATIIATAGTTLLMGLYARWPLALAPGMGTNAWFTYAVVLGMGFTWQVALGATFISGILMVFFTVLPIRKAMIDALPSNLKIGITAGIGLFLMVIGLKASGIIVTNPNTLANLGDLSSPAVLLSILGFFIIVGLDILKVPGAILISIFTTALISLIIGLTEFSGIVTMPPSIAPTFLQLDIANALKLGVVTIVLSLFLVDFFNSTGVFVGLLDESSQKDYDKGVKKALLTDGAGTIFGSLLGVNTVTTYSESAVAKETGGRTGLTSVTIAFLFLCLLFFSPLLALVPSSSTAPVLIFISFMMFKSVNKLDWNKNPEEMLPTFLTLITMPITYSIFNGIGIGIISFIICKLFAKKWQNSYYTLCFIAIAFILSLTL